MYVHHLSSIATSILNEIILPNMKMAAGVSFLRSVEFSDVEAGFAASEIFRRRSRHVNLICLWANCIFRLRHIVKKIQSDEISKEDLIKNLEYAAQVLETVYIDETRCVLLVLSIFRFNNSLNFYCFWARL